MVLMMKSTKPAHSMAKTAHVCELMHAAVPKAWKRLASVRVKLGCVGSECQTQVVSPGGQQLEWKLHTGASLVCHQYGLV